MSMTELERRCVDALAKAQGLDTHEIAALPISTATGNLLDEVRAVLAEAGVAEMRQTIAEAYQAGADAVHKAWVDTGGNVPGYPDFWEAAHDYADSAKIGANQ